MAETKGTTMTLKPNELDTDLSQGGWIIYFNGHLAQAVSSNHKGAEAIWEHTQKLYMSDKISLALKRNEVRGFDYMAKLR